MKKVTFGILAALMMASCDSNEDRPSVVEMPEEGIAARLTLSLPTAGSRSETVAPDDNTNSDAGYEIGQASENHINSVLIVLADQVQNGTGVDYNFIAFAQADATENNADDGSSLPKFTVRIKSPEILAKAGKKVYVFAFCNPTADIVAKVETWKAKEPINFEKLNASLSDDTPIWMANNFLMTNRDLCSKELPEEKEMQNSTIKNPIDLGTVKVQRAAVRFDFESTTAKDETKPNFYPVSSVYDATKIEGYVELVGMSLFNMSKTFNYLPMMSANADWKNPVVCERENSNNWVLSTNYDIKSTYTGGDVSKEFDFATSVPGFAPGNADYTMISSLTADDYDDNWQPSKDTSYKIWRYATENTIPGKDEQLHGITTGVLFKGYLRGKAGSDLDKMLLSGKVLYAYEGHIYGDKDQLKAKAEEAPTTTLAALYAELFTADNMDANGDLKSTIEDGFTIYRPETVGSENVYPCYYYYYNRHDDNKNPIEMGQMEFAVVRNNVYKLKINTINEFGHPGKPGDDPDSEKPGDPDESPKTYFQLSVQALPWVVRVNTIDF
ncbi:MAG: Mfa1 family fimbria major subunit [Bacteroides sp.]|nr:Mfa1 family fimbria major subunit [Bacteroides sp.]MCM1389648.1 Mfa1 family fimbria major subunit [Bacteroides sp.]